MTAILLAIWFVVTSWRAGLRANSMNHLHRPPGLLHGAQGSLIVYVLIIWFYARYMNNMDQEYGF